MILVSSRNVCLGRGGRKATSLDPYPHVDIEILVLVLSEITQDSYRATLARFKENDAQHSSLKLSHLLRSSKC
jgi:hypothetical protein